MKSYRIKNTSDVAIKFTIINKDNKQEDHIMYPGEEREMEKLCDSSISFAEPVNISFRQKKAISKKFKLGTKIVKEMKEGVKGLDIPDDFVLLKIKALAKKHDY